MNPNLINCKNCYYIDFGSCVLGTTEYIVDTPKSLYDDNILKIISILPNRFEKVIQGHTIIEHSSLISVQESTIQPHQKFHICGGDDFYGICRKQALDIHLFYFNEYFNISDRKIRILRKLFTFLHELQHGFQHTKISKKHDRLVSSFDKDYGTYTDKNYKWIEENADDFAYKFLLRHLDGINSLFDIELKITDVIAVFTSLHL